MPRCHDATMPRRSLTGTLNKSKRWTQTPLPVANRFSPTRTTSFHFPLTGGISHNFLRREVSSKDRKELEELQAQLKRLMVEEQFPVLTNGWAFWTCDISDFKRLDNLYTRTEFYCKEEAKLRSQKTRRRRKQQQLRIGLLWQGEQGLKAATPAAVALEARKPSIAQGQRYVLFK